MVTALSSRNTLAGKKPVSMTPEELISLVAEAPLQWSSSHIAAATILGCMLAEEGGFADTIKQTPQALANIARCRRLHPGVRDTALLILTQHEGEGATAPDNRFARGFERRQKLRTKKPKACGGPVPCFIQ
jgi:hypothetical protein